MNIPTLCLFEEQRGVFHKSVPLGIRLQKIFL